MIPKIDLLVQLVEHGVVNIEDFKEKHAITKGRITGLLDAYPNELAIYDDDKSINIYSLQLRNIEEYLDFQGIDYCAE